MDESLPVIVESEKVQEHVFFVPNEARADTARTSAPDAGPGNAAVSAGVGAARTAGAHVEDVRLEMCAIAGTKFGLIFSCPPEALTRMLEAATAPEAGDGR